MMCITAHFLYGTVLAWSIVKFCNASVSIAGTYTAGELGMLEMFLRLIQRFIYIYMCTCTCMYYLFSSGLSRRERVWAVQSADGGDWLVLLWLSHPRLRGRPSHWKIVSSTWWTSVGHLYWGEQGIAILWDCVCMCKQFCRCNWCCRPCSILLSWFLFFYTWKGCIVLWLLYSCLQLY